MAQLEQDYKEARETGTFHLQISNCCSRFSPSIEDGEDEWGLSNPNHATVEEDSESESDEPRE